MNKQTAAPPATRPPAVAVPGLLDHFVLLLLLVLPPVLLLPLRRLLPAHLFRTLLQNLLSHSSCGNAGSEGSAGSSTGSATQTDEYLSVAPPIQGTASLVLDSMGDSIFIVDASGIVMHANRKACDTFMYEHNQMIGYELAHLMPERYRNAHSVGFSKVAAGGHSKLAGKSVSIQGLRSNGEEFPIELNISMFTDSEGHRMFGGCIREMTAVVSGKLQFEEMSQQLAAANAVKGHFLANLGHELLSPINGILGMGELLLDTDLSQKQRVMCQNQILSGKLLLSHINDILDMQVLSRGVFQFKTDPVDLYGLAEGCILQQQSSHLSPQVAFIVTIKRDCARYLRSDAGRLRQCFTRLLDNSLKVSITMAL